MSVDPVVSTPNLESAAPGADPAAPNTNTNTSTSTSTTTTPDTTRTVRVHPDDPRAAPLLVDLEREYVERYGEGARQELTRYPAERFTPEQGGAFLLLFEEPDGDTSGGPDAEPVAGGAYMRDEHGDAEIKRMWTRTDRRRRGLASRVLGELESDARAHGYERMVLGTGHAQGEAVALYLATGWTPSSDVDGDWRSDPGWIEFRKTLAT